MARRYHLPFFLENKYYKPRKKSKHKKSLSRPGTNLPSPSILRNSPEGEKPQKTKECYHCHQFKPLSSFFKNRRKRGGLNHICRQCAKKQRIRFRKRWEKERQRTKLAITEKRCIRCHKILPLSAFTIDRDMKEGHSNICRSCSKKDVQYYHEEWMNERKATGTPKEKRCSVCHQMKPASFFYDTISIKDGLYNVCKECYLAQKQDLQQQWKKERANQPSLAQKTCHHCRHILPITAFHHSDHTKDGVEHICKLCSTQRRRALVSRWSEDRKTHPIIIEEKTCPRCKKRLPVSSFYPNENQKDGYSEYCETCSRRLRQHYQDKWEDERKKQFSKEKTAQCELCHNSLPLTEFHKDRRYKKGHSSVCIACTNQKFEWYIQKWQTERKEPPTEKECRHCHRILPIKNFRKNRRRKDGIENHCNACYKEKMNSYINRWGKERKHQDNDFNLFQPFEKTCTSCKRALPLSMFYTKKWSKNGYVSTCKDCTREQGKRYLERMKRQPKVIPKEKVCFSCQQLLPASAFNRSLHTPDGLYIYCKTCCNKKQREYLSRPGVRERHLKRSREYNKQQYHDRKKREKTPTMG